ncbi:MAG: alanine racemase [Lachnospiraceae bacterium]|nr:alanine racemase [Lachnospiraceae bacterium]
METYRRVCAEVDLDALLHNVAFMRAGIRQDTRMLAVIKTDGYGHGGIPIAKSLEPLDYLYGFATATPEEAFLLRENGIQKPILVLGYSYSYAYERMAKEGIRPAVFEKEQLDELKKSAQKAGKKIQVHIKVDTGMGRIGITPDEEGLAFVREVMEYAAGGSLAIEGIFTHFARADEVDKGNAMVQLTRFESFVEQLEQKLGLKGLLRHCSNSAGILELPQANMDIVRAGISLYGLRPSDDVVAGTGEMQPVLSLKSSIVYIKTVHAGQSVSYGGTFTAEKDTRVATIPVGYGDGYPRALSGPVGYVLIHGKKAPILGRVCMDQFMVDVSHIPEAAMGDCVTLIGADGEERITVEMLGDLSGRFNYELVCDLGNRVPRVFIKDGKVIAAQDLSGYHE